MGVQIELKKTCSLSKHGYALKLSVVKRHRALKAAMAEYGSAYVIQKLNVLAIYRKNNPKLKAALNILQQDIGYVQKTRNAMSTANRTKNLKTIRNYRDRHLVARRH